MEKNARDIEREKELRNMRLFRPIEKHGNIKENIPIMSYYQL